MKLGDEDEIRDRLLEAARSLSDLYRLTLSQLYFALVIAGSALPPDSYRVIRRTILQLPDQTARLSELLEQVLRHMT